MNGSSQSTCRKNCWITGLVGGLLVAAMFFFVAQHTFISSLIVGAIVAVLLGLFLVWAFCAVPAQAESAVTPPPPAAPEPEPVVEAAPAPVPAPAPEPAPPAPAPAVEVAAPAPVIAAVPAAPAEPPAPANAEAVPAMPKVVSAPAFITPVAARPASAAPVPEAAPEPEPKPARKAAKPRGGFALDAAVAKSKEPVAKAGPELLTAPRGGKPDDLKSIKGVGPKLEKLLNDVGVWHFDQIASWKAKDIAIVDEMLVGFKGRISRDGWVKQAKVLAKGGATEFSKRVAKGDVY